MPSYTVVMAEFPTFGKSENMPSKRNTINAKNIDELRKKVISKMPKNIICYVWNGNKAVGRLNWSTWWNHPVWYPANDESEFPYLLDPKTGKIRRN